MDSVSGSDPRKVDRREGDRRVSRQPLGWPDKQANVDRRGGDRRSQAMLDYDAATVDARAALLAHGLDSPEFAAAIEATEELRRLSREIDGSGNL